MNTVYLLIGGNLGNVRETFRNAIDAIGHEVGVVSKESSLYETAAWGMENQPAFLNQVLEAQTMFSAREVLEKVLKIEQELGRIRAEKNGPRIIDIDILFYNKDIIDEPALKVPHPLLHKRNFTLFPLSEIASALVHPVFQKNIQALLSETTDTLTVKKLEK